MQKSYSISLSHLYWSFRAFFKKTYFGYIQGHDYFDDEEVLLMKNYLGKLDEGVIQEFESKFASLVGNGNASSFASGRMGFFCLLKILSIGDGDEVILNGSTCAVMANAVLRSGAKPIYSDIDVATFGSCPEEIKKHITDRTKIIVAQHSFGIPCKIDQISKIAQDSGIFLLEDCAISLGSSVEGRNVGTFGDAALFSTDHTKPINTITGGLIYTSDNNLYEQISLMRNRSQELSRNKQQALWTRFLYEKTYCNHKKFGQMQFLDFLYRVSNVFMQKEKPFLDEDGVSYNRLNSYPYPAKLPSFLAKIGCNEIDNWSNIMEERRELLRRYLEIFENTEHFKLLPKAYFDKRLDIIPLRFVWAQTDTSNIRDCIKDFLHISQTWFTEPIISTEEALINFGYNDGDCPLSEASGKSMVNLPTSMNKKDSELFLSLIKKILIN